MTHRLGTLLVAGSLALVAACASTPAGAQQPLRPSGFLAGAAKPKADYAALPQGDAITSGGESYVVLSDVRAVPSDPGQEPAGLNVLERKGRFVVYRETRPHLKSPSAMTVQDAGLTGQPLLTHAVVLNPRTGNLGVVIGTLIVKLADMTQAEAIGAAHGLTLSSRFDHLNLAFYTAGPGQDIAAAAAALRADARVTSADPEILEHVRAPN
jgi:hypothetical protein